jgi:aspartate/tyrosine/aromatic aminotransferase
MLAALRGAAAGDVVVFHACCHNPSGMDPDAQQWAKLAEFARERKVLPMFDFAYQGFGDGIDEDAAGLRAFCAPGAELLVCSSFSKNFGLYNERVGALTVVAANNAAAEAAFSHVKSCIRSNYSNPPSHGGAIVTKILGTPPLRALWEKEVEEMRGRINGMRHALVEELRKQGVQRDFSFIARQKGMFSFSGLDKAQVERLRDEFGVYIVGSGRISIAGLNSRNIGPLCAAIARVI